MKSAFQIRQIYRSPLFPILLIASSLLVLIFAFQGSASAASEPVTIRSRVVCAPGTHWYCLPGPFSKTYQPAGGEFVTVDVYLIHTGCYEDNEQSSFTSQLGDIEDCGPIPPDTDKLYCGQVSGWIDGDLELTIEHSGEGPETGSHKQEYVITALSQMYFLPVNFNY